MVGASLTHNGEELLETRGGVADYVTRRSTMGIPFLHPWGNRIEGSYTAAGKHVEIDPATQTPPLRPDPNGLPIHGALAADPRWTVTETSADETTATLVARFDYTTEDLLEVFPYPHTIEQKITLENQTLTVKTTITPHDGPVPIAFGFHPYFKLRDAANAEIDIPATTHIVTDARSIPTGETEELPIAAGPIGVRSWDDGYERISEETAFVVTDGNRTISITFAQSYPVLVVWRPEGGDFICIEPMTAPTNALVSGDGLREATPGNPFTASFAIAVRG